MAKKLVRSRGERVLLGVLGGLAEHLEVDPTLVRLVFIVLLVFNPVAMTLLYFLAALIIPEEGGEVAEEPLSDRVDTVVNETSDRLGEIFSGNENSKAIALVFILLGALLLAGPFIPVFMPAVDFRTLAALVFLIVGIILLVRGD